MKRFALIAFLVTVAVTSYAQDIYTPRVLLTLGLSADEAEKVVQIERETAASVRPLQADLDVKKAELARLLIDASPNMRLVERNLRATADIVNCHEP